MALLPDHTVHLQGYLCPPRPRNTRFNSFLFIPFYSLIHTHGFRVKSRTGLRPCTENPKREKTTNMFSYPLTVDVAEVVYTLKKTSLIPGL